MEAINHAKLTIQYDGKVGIGKTNPGTALDVNGTATATSFSGGGAGLTGVDADLLGGASASASAGNNTIVKRHSSGYIFANYFNTDPNDVTTGVTKVVVETGNDGYMRHGTAAAIREFVNVENGATADQSASEILTAVSTVDGAASGLDADVLDGVSSGSFLRSDAADTFTGQLTMGTQPALVASNYGHGVYGVYDSYKYQHVWSMGTAYNLPANGVDTSGPAGSLYGLAWSYPRAETPQAIAGLSHQLLVMINGTTNTAIGAGIWTSGAITASGGNSGSWNTAYTDRLKWDGGSSGLTAATGRTSLGIADMYTYGVNSQGSDGQVWTSDGSARGGWEAGLWSNGTYGIYSIDRVNIGTSSSTEWYMLDVKTTSSFKYHLRLKSDDYGPGVGEAARFTANNSRLTVEVFAEAGVRDPYGDISLLPDGGIVSIGTNSPPATRLFYVDGEAGGTGAWNNDSDLRLKKNIVTVDNAMEKVSKLRGVNFEWKDTSNHAEGIQIGLIAQEVKEVLPEVVSKAGEYYSIQYAPINALLIEAIKELEVENEIMKAKNETMEAENELIKARIEALENK
ncbi:tail fiber domain-containing protein [Candidatus Margulisiibacteriota bacterium]